MQDANFRVTLEFEEDLTPGDLEVLKEDVRKAVNNWRYNVGFSADAVCVNYSVEHMINPALVPDDNEPGCNNFTLSENHNFCWITAKGLSIYIDHSMPDGLVIEIADRGSEDDVAPYSLFVPYPEKNNA